MRSVCGLFDRVTFGLQLTDTRFCCCSRTGWWWARWRRRRSLPPEQVPSSPGCCYWSEKMKRSKDWQSKLIDSLIYTNIGNPPDPITTLQPQNLSIEGLFGLEFLICTVFVNAESRSKKCELILIRELASETKVKLSSLPQLTFRIIEVRGSRRTFM